MGKKVAWNAGVFYDAPLYAGSSSTSISVVEAGTSTLITLYSDADGTSLSNPFNISVAGKVQFYADAGRYDITATLGSDTITWEDEELFSPALDEIQITSNTTIGPEHFRKFLVITGANNINLTVPKEATDDLEDGFFCEGIHRGTGTLTIVPEETGPDVPTITPSSGATLEVEVDGVFGLGKLSIVGVDQWSAWGKLVTA